MTYWLIKDQMVWLLYTWSAMSLFILMHLCFFKNSLNHGRENQYRKIAKRNLGSSERATYDQVMSKSGQDFFMGK